MPVVTIKVKRCKDDTYVTWWQWIKVVTHGSSPGSGDEMDRTAGCDYPIALDPGPYDVYVNKNAEGEPALCVEGMIVVWEDTVSIDVHRQYNKRGELDCTTQMVYGTVRNTAIPEVQVNKVELIGRSEGESISSTELWTQPDGSFSVYLAPGRYRVKANRELLLDGEKPVVLIARRGDDPQRVEWETPDAPPIPGLDIDGG